MNPAEFRRKNKKRPGKNSQELNIESDDEVFQFARYYNKFLERDTYILKKTRRVYSREFIKKIVDKTETMGTKAHGIYNLKNRETGELYLCCCYWDSDIIFLGIQDSYGFASLEDVQSFIQQVEELRTAEEMKESQLIKRSLKNALEQLVKLQFSSRSTR